MIASTSPQVQRKSQETEKLVLVKTDRLVLDAAFKCIPLNMQPELCGCLLGQLLPLQDMCLWQMSVTRQKVLLLSSLSVLWEGRTRCLVPHPARREELWGTLDALPWPICGLASTVWVLETPSLVISPAPGCVSQGQALEKVF